MSTSSAVLEVTPARAIQSLQDGLGFSDEELAAALGVTPRSLKSWRAGTTHPQQLARQRLTELLRLQQRVAETFEGAGAIREWLHRESRYLGGLTPADAIRVGRLDRAEAALEALDSGIAL